jgi:hypothetical protein
LFDLNAFRRLIAKPPSPSEYPELIEPAGLYEQHGDVATSAQVWDGMTVAKRLAERVRDSHDVRERVVLTNLLDQFAEDWGTAFLLLRRFNDRATKVIHAYVIL